MNIITNDDKKLLLDLICAEQVNMIIADHTSYESEKYKRLEHIKVLVKDI